MSTALAISTCSQPRTATRWWERASLTVGGGAASLHALCVKPGWRNRGIGKLLVSYALKAAGTYGQTTAMLKATRLSAPLCLELGFTPFGTVAEHAWKPPGSTGTGGPKDSVDVPAGLPRDSAKGPEPMPRGPRARCPAISPMHSWAWQDCEKQASQEPRRRSPRDTPTAIFMYAIAIRIPPQKSDSILEACPTATRKVCVRKKYPGGEHTPKMHIVHWKPVLLAALERWLYTFPGPPTGGGR